MAAQPLERALESLQQAVDDRVGLGVGARRVRAEQQLVGEEVIAFVIHEDEGGEDLHGDFPDGFHAELFVFEYLETDDVVLSKKRRRATCRGEIETAVLVIGVGDLLGAVSFGEHDH